MSDETKSIWKKTLRGPRGFLLGFIALVVVSFAIITAIGLMMGCIGEALKIAVDWTGIISGVLIIFAVLASFFRGLFSKGWRWTTLRLAGFAVLIVAFYTEEYVRGRWAWEHFRREWEAKGEKFDFKAFIPPLVPDEQNFALTPIVASCYSQYLTRDGHKLNPQDTNVVDRLDLSIYRKDYWSDSPTNGSWQKATLTDLKSWQTYYFNSLLTNGNDVVTHEFPVAAQPQTPAADVLLALSRYDAPLKELAEASRLPAARFPLNYENENPAAIWLPHLAAMKRCAQVLELRAQAELEAGQSAKACDDTLLIFQLTDKIRNEPFLITHLVRLAMLQIAIQAVYEGLATHRWADADLTRLAAEIRRQNLAADCQFAMRGEMVWQCAISDYLRKHPGELMSLMDMTCLHDSDSPIPLTSRLLGEAIPSGWFYQNKLNCARTMVGKVIPIADATNGTFSVKAATLAAENYQKFTPLSVFHYFEKMLTPAMGSGCKKFAVCQNALNLAETAVALERYRLAHGAYPEFLSALAPQFITKLPHDVINDQPLKYRREADGRFVLYSVGWNETDDGGVVGFRESSPDRVEIDKGDWVWRYPQK